MLMLLADADADADADGDAVAGLLKVSLKLPGKMRQTSMRCRSPIDVYIEGRMLRTCEWPVNTMVVWRLCLLCKEMQRWHRGVC